MSMNANITILVLICNVVYTVVGRYEDYDNVGTVLFTKKDLKTLLWKKKNIMLLEARRNFQKLLPPSSVLGANKPSVLISLYDYFGNTYNIIKQENMEPELKDIMISAFLDTLGGYFKCVVLPVTKYSFYTGSLGLDDGLRIVKLYEEIKSLLKTNGSGWHNPNKNYLEQVSFCEEPHHTEPKGRYSCDKLTFLENTDRGLTVPLPRVVWQRNAEYMFLPMRNESLIHLMSNDSIDSLVKYYNTAKYCIENNKLGDANSFTDSFRTWLTENVIPHLGDDQLYPALRNVLSLTNDSYASVLMNNCPDGTACPSAIPIRDRIMHKYLPKGSHPSKKLIVLGIVIMLEVAWCIPAVCYLIYKKCCPRKKKKCQIGSKFCKKIIMQFSKKTKYTETAVGTSSRHDNKKSQALNTLRSKDGCCYDGSARLSESMDNKEPTQDDHRGHSDPRYEYLSNKQLYKKIDHFSVETERRPKMQISQTVSDRRGCRNKRNKSSALKSYEVHKDSSKETIMGLRNNVYRVHESAPQCSKPSKSIKLKNTRTVTLIQDVVEVGGSVVTVVDGGRGKEGSGSDKNVEAKSIVVQQSQQTVCSAVSKGNQPIVDKSSKTTMVFSSVESKPETLLSSNINTLKSKKGSRTNTKRPLEITIGSNVHEIRLDITTQPEKEKPSKIPKRSLFITSGQAVAGKACSSTKRKSHIPMKVKTTEDIEKSQSSVAVKLNNTL